MKNKLTLFLLLALPLFAAKQVYDLRDTSWKQGIYYCTIPGKTKVLLKFNSRSHLSKLYVDKTNVKERYIVVKNLVSGKIERVYNATFKKLSCKVD